MRAWREINEFEQSLLDDTRARYPEEVLRLARYLSLTPRIEPLLLRNARRRFLPHAETEVESLLWFCPLVAARSTGEIVLHLGVAGALAEELEADERRAVWDFIREHTRHWTADNRLERDLRYDALRQNQRAATAGLRDILRQIHAERDDERRVDLSRLVKRTLPAIASFVSEFPETRWLTQYAAGALGDAGDWAVLATPPGEPEPLPDWLGDTLPEPFATAELGLEVRQDAVHGQVLHLVAAETTEQKIAFLGPLPAWLYVAAESRPGAWHAVTVGSRIRIDPPSPWLRLTARDGTQWELRTDEVDPPSEEDAAATEVPSPLLLAYVEDDETQARRIARWLERNGIPVELVAEAAHAVEERPTKSAQRVLRLWTGAARRFWADREVDQVAGAGGVLLRIEDVELPGSGPGGGDVLEWRDWSRMDDSPDAGRLLRNLRQWRSGGQIEPDVDDAVPEDDAAYDDEIAALIAEIDNPATEPPRRLAIGDRLAELGDPRPGVGVIEIELPAADAVAATATREEFSPRVRRLFEQIDDEATEPPQRLEIGDELGRLGDPRHGVGLDARGLPDIDWVEIPGGDFVYQEDERRALPTFWIARYPITNSQFQAFVDDGGYDEQRWWRDLEKPAPEASHWPQPNWPRTNVDWYEAVAFTRWLTARLGVAEGSVRLPSEYEWEKAARGPQGLIYPWGDEYRPGFANLDEKEGKDGPWYLEQPTAVGMYPRGRSVYGVEDMAGNVWEWCVNKVDDPDDTTEDSSSAPRGLRGGSWYYDTVNARADFRDRLRPDGRFFRGFRVLASVPIAGR